MFYYLLLTYMKNVLSTTSRCKKNYVGIVKKKGVFLKQGIKIFVLQESFLDKNPKTRFSDI